MWQFSYSQIQQEWKPTPAHLSFSWLHPSVSRLAVPPFIICVIAFSVRFLYFFFCRRERACGETHGLCKPTSRVFPFLLIQGKVQHREYSGIETEHLVYICKVFCEFVWIRLRLGLFKLSLFPCLRNRSDPVVNKNLSCWIVSSCGEVQEVAWVT
jgi:hypothetical protein